jgi:3-oxoacyl-[acyl-carrier-protein] synthase II
VLAAGEALAHGGVGPHEIDAVCVGTTMGDLPEVEAGLAGDRWLEPAAAILSRGFAERIADALGVAAAADTIATSCSAGNLAICRARDLVRSGRASRVLAGGADAFSRLAFVGFARMRAMAPLRCTPFARDRKGILLGEGAAFVVVESRASAERRGAPVHALVAGAGLTCDAYHVSTPAPHGRGTALAIRQALADAGVEPDEVDFVSAHGTGTPHNDVAESHACASVFGRHRPYVSSLKALIGHTLGAAGAIQAVACALALRDQRIVPAWHVDTPDPDCDVELPLPGCVQPRSLRVVISNGLAFGGNNSCLVLRADA